MKIAADSDKYKTMQAAITSLVNHIGIERVRAELNNPNNSPTRIYWMLWNVAYDNLHYNDQHPSFANGSWTRVYPYTPEFDVYDNDTNDNNIETAIKRIITQLLKN